DGTANTLTNTELYDVGLGYSNSWQPQITSITSPLSPGSSLVITGAQFRGRSEGSSGDTQDSSSDYPLVQLRSLASGQTTFLQTTNWSTNTAVSTAVWNFPPGWALATVFVNGIQSTSAIVNISVPTVNLTIVGSGTFSNGFRFTLTNNSGALLGVSATTNLTLPLTNWTVIGRATEISPGQFQFADSITNQPSRFYRLFTP
ncbi:MAG TPA: hypothetical protein VNM37_26255, partial [Candidatus Dormibacteraeota bacterium]|nr:hypothetical protein [Candidatus Dormibacteraeota bacterium]